MKTQLWVAACPALLGIFRRSHTTGIKSKVHPTYKTKYRVANWPAYNQGLLRRGDVTVWLTSEAIAAWTPCRSGRRGGQRRYSDLAIETALTLRLLYHLPLRQAEGFLHALFGIMRLDLSVPDYTTLSRRSQHLRLRLRPIPPGEGLHLVLDSTGLSIVGAGEWAAATHGGCGRRGWRKLHLGVDQSGGYCQVDEKLVDRPPRYWARASREPAMLGIRNGRQPQLDNTPDRSGTIPNRRMIGPLLVGMHVVFDRAHPHKVEAARKGPGASGI